LSVTAKEPIFRKSKNKEVYTLSIVNANGSIVENKLLASNATIQIATSSYPAGIYLLVLKNKGGVIKSTKVVKIK
jgi:hypothetical protein